jgi:hypothetical protein
VLRRVLVHVRERHLVLEKRIPPRRESHRAIQVRLVLCVQASFERSDNPVERGTHSLPRVEARAGTGAPIVDDVEGGGSGVEHCGEGSTDRVRQAADESDQRQQSAHHHVAEHHVEEQLSVRPPGAVAGSGEFFLAGGFEQRMEGRPRPFEPCANRLTIAIVTVQRRTDSSWNGRLCKPASAWVVHRAGDGATYGREEPAVSGVWHRGFTHLGVDVAKDSIVVAVLEPDRDRAPVEKVFHDEVSVGRLIGRFEDRSKL